MTGERLFRHDDDAGAFDWRRAASELGVDIETARVLRDHAMHVALGDPQRAERMYLGTVRAVAARQSAQPTAIAGRITRLEYESLPGKYWTPAQLAAAGPGVWTLAEIESTRRESQLPGYDDARQAMASLMGTTPAVGDHVAKVRDLLRSIGAAIDDGDVNVLAAQYGGALDLTRWALGAHRQELDPRVGAQRIGALIDHARGHARGHVQPTGWARPPRVVPLDQATRDAVERTTGVALGDVTVERHAELGMASRLGDAGDSTIRLAPAASGDDALGREVRLHEAIHIAQGRVADAPGPAPADRTRAVEADAHAAAGAAARGEPHRLGVKAAPGQRYGFDLGDVANALGIDPMKFLREHFPQVAGFFQGGFGPMLQRLGDAAGGAIRGVLDRVGVGDLQAGFDAITGSFKPDGLAFGILNGCCECLEHALDDLMKSVQGMLHSNSAQKVQSWIARAQDAENDRLIDSITDFFGVLQRFGGPVLAGIEQVGRWIDQADAAIGHSIIWRAIAPVFGLDGGLSPIEAIKKKMSQMWEAVKAGVEAIKRGLAALWAKIKANPVVAGILKFAGDCGKLVTAIQKVREAKSRDPKAWLGILARELKGTVFQGLVSALQSGYSSIVELKNTVVGWFVGILDATGLLAVFNTAVPFLNMVGHAIQGLAQTIQTTVQRLKAAIERALAQAAKALKDLWTTVEPYVSFVVGLGAAIAMTMGGDILALPRFFVGQLWLHVLPQCYKEALVTFLLDLFIALVEWFPARHPIMIFLRSAALSFLRTVKAAPMPQKVGAMDTIAKVLSNDVEVLAGFFVGVVKGLWNSSLGFLVQMAIMPFTMAWDVLSSVGKKVGELAGQAFGVVFHGASWLVNAMANAKEIHPDHAGGAGGTASSAPAHPAGGPDPSGSGGGSRVEAPVTVDPAAPPASATGVDTPDSEVVRGPGPSAPRSPADHQPGPAPAAGPDTRFDDPPPFPSLPPLGSLVDPIFRHGVSREQVEAMFKKFNIAMDQWGTRMGREGANKILPYLNARSAPYDIGEIIGEVVGWLAGEIIMLVATDGIENAIAKVLEGAMDGARIMAKIGEYFPRLVEWISEMRRLIAPLIEAVEKIAAKAKEFLQKIMKWLEELLAWVKRQWAKLLKWAEETFGEAGRALRRLLGAGEAVEAELEAIEAANYAFERLDVQLLNEAVPLTALEAKLHALRVPHTPDVQIHLHVVTTTHWRIEATAIRSGHRGVGLSVGRGAVLWTHDTLIPYYTASGHSVRHEALLDAASQQLYREAQAVTTVERTGGDLAAEYRRVEELTRATQREYQAMLPIRNTQFLIRLEPMNSHDVRDKGYSHTEFIITPNAAKKWKDIPVTGGHQGFLGAVPTGTGRQFRGHFGPVPEPNAHTVWDWDDGEPYPSGPVARHPANEHLGYQNHGNLRDIRPLPVPYTFQGGGTEGALDGDKAIWLAILDGKIDRLKRQLLAGKPNPTPADEAAAQADAEHRLLAWYQQQYPDLQDMSDLRLQGNGGRRWQAHHVHEHSWGGHNSPYNYQFLPLPAQHARFTAWWSHRQARIQQALFGYQR